MSCGVGHRHSLDPVFLWLWCRPAAAALIQPLAWEYTCAADVALKKKELSLILMKVREHLYLRNRLLLVFLFFWPHLYHMEMLGPVIEPTV